MLPRDGIVSGGVPRDDTGLTGAFLFASLSEGDRVMATAILRLRAAGQRWMTPGLQFLSHLDTVIHGGWISSAGATRAPRASGLSG
ncbi:hypothetical protein BE21_49100 [Sorangium cellulosum]|uniref:Uncharacterized protein n=1 Tax=Sorangium cellulosum TaxID=56 RepID=A0A150TH40_SORCE|nr:hypothetical protein BE21_49100 [Sorangium cellulosum]